MTVLDNTPRDQYTASASQTVFPYTFEIAAIGDIKVLQNGVLINQGAGAGEYGVSGVGVDTGGNVTLVTGATAGDVLTLYRDMALNRLTSYNNAGDFLAADVNNDFDRLWLALQQNTGNINRALVAPDSDPTDINMTIPDKAARLDKLLKFNATTGNPEAVSATSVVGSGAFNVYDFAGDGTTVAFTLGTAPGVENNTQVYIDGVYQQKNTYTVSGTTLTFSVAPLNLSSIEVVVVTAQPVNTTNSASVSFTQTGASDTRTVQVKLEESISVLDFGADPTGAADSTLAIQAAHDASVAGDYQSILFPAGVYKFTSLTWSPHIGASTSGKVYLETALASGDCIHVSDQYGSPSRYGLNSVSNRCWGGQFYLRNTNGANIATAWVFGGTTAANYCPLVSFEGIETRGFLGGYHKYLYNAFSLDFYSCFDENNGGNHISVGLGITNVVTQANYISCRFGSGAGYLFSLNNATGIVFNMTACECVFLGAGFIEPGNTAALSTIYWNGGNIEWTQVAAPHVDNNTATSIIFNGARLAPQATSGWPTPVISRTQGSTTTSFINCKHVLPGVAMPVLHTYPDATSRGVLDYAVDWYGGNALNIYYTANAAATIGFNGIRESEEAYTPAFNGTLGNGSVLGKATRVGNRIDYTIFFTKGTTTTFAASTTFGLTTTSITGYESVGVWYGNNFGIGDISGISRVASASTALTLKNMDGTNVGAAAAGAWGNGTTISISFTIFV